MTDRASEGEPDAALNFVRQVLWEFHDCQVVTRAVHQICGSCETRARVIAAKIRALVEQAKLEAALEVEREACADRERHSKEMAALGEKLTGWINDCDAERVAKEKAEARVAELEKELAGFVCKARTATADPPQDCDWPHCGCDPKAEKILEALSEEGWLSPRERDAAQSEAKALRASIERVRDNWPHIEVPDGPMRFLHGKRELKDPGTPACLRCKIEALLSPAPPAEPDKE